VTLIRPGTIEDAAFMHALDGLVPGRPRKLEWYEDALRAGEALVAMLDSVQAGFAVHHRHFFDRDFLSLLIVEPWCRRRGVASTLLDAVEAKCPGSDLFTSTNESNTVMRAALRKWGFRPTGRIDNIDPGDPELVFLKRSSGSGMARRGV
jgi:GNAT superfamily N-acetyltransferase